MNYSTRLTTILKAAGWTQEQLAHRLGVSFVTLNSWINGHSRPRQGAQDNIQRLYLDIVGVDHVSEVELRTTKLAALRLKTTAEKIRDSKTSFDNLTLYLTYHTNTIEGSTMTLSDVEEVVFNHKVLTNRTAIEQTEARNHKAALNWLIGQLIDRRDDFEINEELILGIHLRLMNGIISDAGEYRTHTVRILGSHVALANWAKVPELTRQLSAKMRAQPGDIIANLAMTHSRFEQIHPFSDGNGRTGRLLLLAQALQADLVPPLITKERKYAYYKYLEAAQINEDYLSLELLMAQSIQTCHALINDH